MVPAITDPTPGCCSTYLSAAWVIVRPVRAVLGKERQL
jgi:hypothetical protein